MGRRDHRTPRLRELAHGGRLLQCKGAPPPNPTGLSTRHPRGLERVRCGLQGPGRCFSRNTLMLHQCL